MRAMVIPTFGGPGVLTLRELPDPQPGPGEITIDVTHTAVGLVDVLVRRGAFPIFAPPLVPGLSVAGRVRAVSDDVTSLAPGQSVAAFTAPPTMGGYATIARVPAPLAVSLETSIGTVPADAAAVAIVNGPTAYLALVDLADVQPGDPVVVHGATGALAGMVAQLARHLGADPLIGTVGHEGKRAHAETLGYTDVLLSTDDWVAAVRARTGGRGAAAVVDPVGGTLRRQSLDVLRPLGRLLAVGHASDEPDPPISATDLWLGNQAVLELNVGSLSASEPARFNAAARAVMTLVAQGAILADVGAVLPLEEAGEAHRRLEARTAVGTMLLLAGI